MPMVIRKDSMPECVRYDLARFSPKTTRTPQGFLKAPAFFTRAGIFEYQRADGTKVRELRPEDEVFHADSLGTLSSAPLVKDHPQEGMVTPENAKQLAIGWAGEQIERKDSMVSGYVTVMDADTISDVQSGKLREISMGYRCQIDKEEGEHPVFGRYDQIQRNIRYNHVALGGINWGRAGTEVGLRLDSTGAIQRSDAFTQIEHLVMQQADLHGMDREELAKTAGIDLWELEDVLYGFGAPKKATLQKIAMALKLEVQTLINLVPRVDSERKRKMETITIGGVEFEVSKATAQAIRQENARLDSQISELKTENEKLQGRFDAQTEELKGTKEKLEEAQDPKRFDSAVAERIDLVTKARKVLGDEAKIEGTNREIMESVLKHDSKDLDFSNRSDDYVEARFDAFVDTKNTPTTNKGQVRADARQTQTKPTEGRIDSSEAQERMRQRNAEAWKQDLTVTNK